MLKRCAIAQRKVGGILKKLGYKIALISGGFTYVADKLKQQLGIDFVYANYLEVKDGFLTGNVIPPIVNAQRKADLLDVIAQQERIELDQVMRQPQPAHRCRGKHYGLSHCVLWSCNEVA